MDLGSITRQIKEKLDRRKTLEFSGIVFEIGLPSARDEKEINKLIESLGTAEEGGVSARMDALKLYTCAYSVRSIGGDEVPDFFLEEGEKGKVVHVPRIEALKAKIADWPSYITDAIYEAAADLRNSSKKDLDANVKFQWFVKPDLTKDFMAADDAEKAPPAEPLKLVETPPDPAEETAEPADTAGAPEKAV